MRPPVLTHPSAAVFLGDCLDVLAEMPDDSVDAIVTDPPYGLGFMGKAWDDLPPGLPWAAECLRVLKPGGHLLAFGGTRTWHRLAVAVEDAGFEMRDSIAWLYGSGFPKSLDVSKAIDKVRSEDLEPAAAVARFLVAELEKRGLGRRDVCEHFNAANIAQQWTTTVTTGVVKPRVPRVEQWAELRRWLDLPDTMDAEVWRLNGNKGKPGEAFQAREVIGQKTSGIGAAFGDGQWASGPAQVVDVTAPATLAAQQWRGWGTSLKPAFEPIVVARKPLAGTVAANVLQYGTGALNIDGTRIAYSEPAGKPSSGLHGKRAGIMGETVERHRETTAASTAGRWPTNVVLDGDAADELDEQSGEGGASRFFPVFRYQAKAPTRERPSYVKDDGDTHAYITMRGKKVRTCNQCGSRSQPGNWVPGDERPWPACGHGDWSYQDARPEAAPQPGKVSHPTVKPLALMRWLVRLVTPPGGVVLDTFAGSGATIEAAIAEGFYALGIEREETYLPLVEVRLGRVEVPTDGDGEEGAA